MVKIGLQFSASLDDVASLSCKDPGFVWNLKFECSSCQEISSTWQEVSLCEQVPVAGGHGFTHYCAKCKMCKKDIRITILENTLAEYKSVDNEKYKTIVAFDCRGAEPTEFQFGNGWIISTESNTKFSNVDLSEDNGDWTEWDEKLKKTVAIDGSAYKFVKLK